MSVVHGADGKEARIGAKTRTVRRAIAASATPAKNNGSAKNGSPKNETPKNETPKNVLAPFRMPKLRPPTFSARTVDIRDHGAVGDGRIDCTVAIADAIEACASAGGGRVLIPAGEWYTGPIHLKSNIDLHLERGATVRFSTDPGQYLPAVFVRWGGQECYNYSPLIYARGCDNIAITGPGTLLGQGRPWWPWEKKQQQVRQKLTDMVLQGVPVEDRRFGSQDVPLRPQFISPVNCTNVLLEDFTIGEAGPCWTIHLAYCENVTVRRLTISAPDGPQADGIVLDSSRNVLVEECELRANGDAIALKSGMNDDGCRVGKPTENVVVRNTRVVGGTGGVCIGSEMSGGMRNVLVHDCHFDGCGAGIRVKAARGRGGVVEEIVFRDITMGRIEGDAIQLTTEYPLFVSPSGKAPVFRNIQIKNVTCEQAKTAARMIGLPDSALREISLEDVTIAAEQGLQCTAAAEMRLTTDKITPRSGPVLAIRDGQNVLIEGLNNADGATVFLDLRGRNTRQIRLRGETNNHVRPAIVLGLDVPKDALMHE
jgi:polygalacturonase